MKREHSDAKPDRLDSGNPWIETLNEDLDRLIAGDSMGITCSSSVPDDVADDVADDITDDHRAVRPLLAVAELLRTAKPSPAFRNNLHRELIRSHSTSRVQRSWPGASAWTVWPGAGAWTVWPGPGPRPAWASAAKLMLAILVLLTAIGLSPVVSEAAPGSFLYPIRQARFAFVASLEAHVIRPLTVLVQRPGAVATSVTSTATASAANGSALMTPPTEVFRIVAGISSSNSGWIVVDSVGNRTPGIDHGALSTTFPSPGPTASPPYLSPAITLPTPLPPRVIPVATPVQPIGLPPAPTDLPPATRQPNAPPTPAPLMSPTALPTSVPPISPTTLPTQVPPASPTPAPPMSPTLPPTPIPTAGPFCGGVIAGTVRTQNGVPVANAIVTLVIAAGMPDQFDFITDDQGAYRADGLCESTYNVLAVNFIGQSMWAGFYDANGDGIPDDLAVGPGANADHQNVDITIVLQP